MVISQFVQQGKWVEKYLKMWFWPYYVVKLLVCVERTAEEMVHGPRFFSTDNILHTGTVHISDDKIKKCGRDDKI